MKTGQSEDGLVEPNRHESDKALEIGNGYASIPIVAASRERNPYDTIPLFFFRSHTLRVRRKKGVSQLNTPDLLTFEMDQFFVKVLNQIFGQTSG